MRRSTEAEVRDILENAALPGQRVKLGSLLADIGRQAMLIDQEAAQFKDAIERDQTPSHPVRYD